MDFAEFIIQQEEMEEDSEVEDELYKAAGITAAVMLVGIKEQKRLQAQRRNPRRQYLTRPQLLPSPHIHTPWQRLYSGNEDSAYITTMGFDVATFDHILASGFGSTWLTTPIPQTDASILVGP
jgi:hypothetical protein